MYQHNLDVEGLFFYTKTSPSSPSASTSSTSHSASSVTQSESSSSLFEKDAIKDFAAGNVNHGTLINPEILAKLEMRLQAKEITEQVYVQSLFEVCLRLWNIVNTLGTSPKPAKAFRRILSHDNTSACGARDAPLWCGIGTNTQKERICRRKEQTKK